MNSNRDVMEVLEMNSLRDLLEDWNVNPSLLAESKDWERILEVIEEIIMGMAAMARILPNMLVELIPDYAQMIKFLCMSAYTLGYRRGKAVDQLPKFVVREVEDETE